MGKQRILYIDLMKGLSITWVVWFHTIHPAFANYSFRMPLFFLASAIFFRPYPLKEFVEKKVYQMLIPFVLFYLLYYVFMILSSAVSNGSFSAFNYGCILDVFRPYAGNGGPTVNPPLWFIMALLNLQVILYLTVKILRQRWVLMVIAFLVSIWASLFLFETYTYFQFGRALRYLCYYVFGYLFGKDIISIIESAGKRSLQLFSICAIVFATALIGKTIFNNGRAHLVIDYFQITSLVIMLIYFFKYTQHWFIMKPLKYYGANSYIVLGMNEMILSLLLVVFLHMFGHLTVWIGLVHWLLTMVFLIPVIKLMNRYVPWLVGKRNIFEMYRNKKNSVPCTR